MSSKYQIAIPTIGKVAPLKELFIFELANIPFLVGKEPYIAGTGSYERAILLPGFLAALSLGIGVMQSGIFLEVILIALGFILLGAAACWVPYRNRLLSTQGKIIQGRIIESDEYRKNLGSVKVPVLPVRVTSYGWEFSALCAFRTPEGKVISHRRRAIRNDLVEKTTVDGTPVIVLYRNDHHYKIL
ncbi:MAG: hypothetical protein LCI00_26955 [Chloroflexi bacterium]|nr:hypothetical protein [Chloroflexota bacterium]MCC6893983.1 hypothetical protein [Anaerolineae bacterium]